MINTMLDPIYSEGGGRGREERIRIFNGSTRATLHHLNHHAREFLKILNKLQNFKFATNYHFKYTLSNKKRRNKIFKQNCYTFAVLFKLEEIKLENPRLPPFTPPSIYIYIYKKD